MDIGVWRATVHVAVRSWARLSDLAHTHRCVQTLRHSRCGISGWVTEQNRVSKSWTRLSD